MLDSERTFKIKVGKFSKFCLPQQLCSFKEFCMETRLSNIFKTTNVTNLTKVIQESSYRVLQITNFCEIERKPSFNSQYFQGSQISGICLNENA